MAAEEAPKGLGDRMQFPADVNQPVDWAEDAQSELPHKALITYR